MRWFVVVAMMVGCGESEPVSSKYDEGATRLTYTCGDANDEHTFDVKVAEGTMAPMVLWASGDLNNPTWRQRITEFKIRDGKPYVHCGLLAPYTELELVIANDSE